MNRLPEDTIFDPHVGRTRRARHLGGDITFNSRGERFLRGAIVREAPGPAHWRRVRIQRGIVDSVNSATEVAVLWPVREAPAGQCTTRIVNVDALIVIGQAWAMPGCSGETLTHFGSWVPPVRRGQTDSDVAPDRDRVLRWAAEGQWLAEQLQLTLSSQLRDQMEARLVKLDHLMSVYGGR
jgi:hypothetical protein